MVLVEVRASAQLAKTHPFSWGGWQRACLRVNRAALLASAARLSWCGLAMSPKQVVEAWVLCFNQADVEGLMALYAEGAINHQVVTEPLRGRSAIRAMFEIEFGRAQMTCTVDRLLEDGEWAIMEWRDPLGLRGCGFFHVVEGKIVFQRGYFDQLSFFRQQGIAVPDSYLETTAS